MILYFLLSTWAEFLLMTDYFLLWTWFWEVSLIADIHSPLKRDWTNNFTILDEPGQLAAAILNSMVKPLSCEALNSYINSCTSTSAIWLAAGSSEATFRTRWIGRSPCDVPLLHFFGCAWPNTLSLLLKESSWFCIPHHQCESIS